MVMGTNLDVVSEPKIYIEKVANARFKRRRRRQVELPVRYYGSCVALNSTLMSCDAPSLPDDAPSLPDDVLNNTATGRDTTPKFTYGFEMDGIQVSWYSLTLY